MKNLILTFLFGLALFSCDKNSIQQTTDSIKSADSLLTKTNRSLKTLDSLRKTIGDSDGIARKVIIPEIARQRKTIDSTIRSGSYSIDSINKDLEKITKNVRVGTDVVKVLDSANDAINKGESPLKVLTRTADKILKQTRTQNTTPPVTENKTPSPQENAPVVAPLREKNPLTKSATLEIEVEDLSAAKAILKQKVRENNADVVSENFSRTEGIARERMTVKIPLQNFDQFVENISGQLGEVKMKSTASEGTDYVSGQMCDVEIALLQNEKMAAGQFSNEDGKPESFSTKSSGAFMEGFEIVKKMVVAVLPFWPLFLLAGVIIYFIRRNRKRKVTVIAKQVYTPEIEVQKVEPTSKSQNEQTENTAEPDYSKYLPKK